MRNISFLERLRALRKDPRLWVTTLTVLAVAALLILAAGLSQLELLPGKQLPNIFNQDRPQGTAFGLPGGDIILFVIRAFYFLGLICLPFLVIYLILNPKARKQFFRDLVRASALILFFYFVANFLRRMGAQEEEFSKEAGGAYPPALPSVEFFDFTPESPQWLVLVVSALIALLVVGVLGVVLWFVLRRKAPEQPLERIAQEAQAALDAIRAGGDLRNIVIRCYAEMSRVLSEQRGIQRAQHMTPREFEAALAGQGIPKEPVRTLTLIFEEVRYGTIIPGVGEERQALDSLAAIVAACGGQP